jgi:16S rRNA (guanine966-N2)-methyltransferase
MRVIAGTHKGRRIDAPAGTHTRPTADRVRENVFNLVQGWVEESNVLDLFAGSGAMGIEALSRGATRAVLVEEDREACRVIEQNLDALGLTGAELVRRDVAQYVAAETRQFDLVFCDPPYAEYAAFEATLARYVPRLLVDDALLVLETSAKVEPELPLSRRTSRKYGSARITLFEK